MTYELAAMLKEQVLPVLDESGAQTIFVSNGGGRWGTGGGVEGS